MAGRKDEAQRATECVGQREQVISNPNGRSAGLSQFVHAA